MNMNIETSVMETVLLPVPAAPDALLEKIDTVQAHNLLAVDAVEPPPSPCVSVCRMDEQRQYCVGCLRTLDELRAWGKADAGAKRQIWDRVLERSGRAPA